MQRPGIEPGPKPWEGLMLNQYTTAALLYLRGQWFLWPIRSWRSLLLHRVCQCHQFADFVCFFPCEFGFVSPEVAIRGRFFVYGPSQLQGINDSLWGEREEFGDDFGQFFIRYFSRAKRVHIHTHGLCHPNRVRQLYFTFLRQSRSHDVFGDVARHVGRTPIHFARVFSGKCPPIARCVTSLSRNSIFLRGTLVSVLFRGSVSSFVLGPD